MCEFFSFLICRNGGIHYHNAKQRKAMMKTNDNPDSHAQIAKTFELNEDTCIKFEYTPGESTVVVDYCPPWAEDADKPHIAKEHLDKATYFATTFDFKNVTPLWPDNFNKLKQMKRVCDMAKRLSPATMRLIKAMYNIDRPFRTRSGVWEIHGKAAYQVLKVVRNSASALSAHMDELRAIKQLGWLDLTYKKGTKRRKAVDLALRLMEAGIGPEAISYDSGTKLWRVRSIRSGHLFDVDASGKATRV